MVLAVEQYADVVQREPDAIWDQRAQRRLASFARRMFPNYLTAPHITDLVNALEWAASTTNARLIVTMPPRHSKSLHVSELFPAWYLGKFPNNRIIAASHSAALAYTFSRRVRNYIQSDRYPFDVKVAEDKGAVQAWDIHGTRGGYLAVGVGGSPTGQGANLIIIDDPLRSAADAESETVREGQIEWYQGTIRTRLEPGGSIVITATRWHDNDLTGFLLSQQDRGGEQWRVLHFPAIAESGDALWPEHWPLAELERIKASVGSRAWQAQYQGDPQPAEGGMIKAGWWQRYTDWPDGLTSAVITVDSAFKTGVAADYSVFALWASTGTDAYLLNVWRKRIEFPDLIRMGYAAHAWAAEHLPAIASIPLVVEDKASGQSAIQQWRREKTLTVIPFKIPAGSSKESRVEAVSPFIEAGKANVPKGGPGCPFDVDAWLHEHDRFPFGEHDDQVDTTAMALSRLLSKPQPKQMKAVAVPRISTWSH